jgi:cytochrome c oxidase subunit III
MTTSIPTPLKSNNSAAVAEQFDDYAQQIDACLFGMWAFLVSEVMFFGGVFATYLIYRWLHGSAFAAASRELDIYWGTINTFVLLTSSLTIALGVRAAHHGRPHHAAIAIGSTILLGAVFLTIKSLEYVHKFEEGLAPLLGRGFHYEGPDIGGAQIFFGLYFGMTGIHALHMIIGIALLTWLLIHSIHPNPNNPLRIELVGLYWHFVDVVWIFLFPLLYLIDRTK